MRFRLLPRNIIRHVMMPMLPLIHITLRKTLSTQNVMDLAEWCQERVFKYTQYGPIKNGRIKNQHSDFEKNKEPVVRILGLRNIFTF